MQKPCLLPILRFAWPGFRPKGVTLGGCCWWNADGSKESPATFKGGKGDRAVTPMNSEPNILHILQRPFCIRNLESSLFPIPHSAI